MHILCNQNLIINTKSIIYKWIIPIYVTMATKTSYHQRFHKNGLFNEKGLFKANYLLPAWQNMNNIQHILDNPHLLYKYKK